MPAINGGGIMADMRRQRHGMLSASSHGADYATALALKLAAKAYYNCDEGSGNLIDSAGGGYDLTQHNTVGASGGYRTCAAASSQYAAHVDAAALRISGDTGFFLWCKFGAHIDYAPVLVKIDSYGTLADYGIYIAGAGNVLRFAISANGSDWVAQIDSTVNVEDAAAHNVAAWVDVTTDPAHKTINIKVDNEATQSVEFVGTPTGSTSALEFGRQQGTIYGNVSMRMAGLFSKKLTAAEITYLTNGGSGKTWAQIVADAA
jgi:hypothetical protein